MIDAGIPIFDLKSTKEYIFVAGGGASKEPGKGNGIVAIRKPGSGKSKGKLVIADTFVTDEPITDIHAYEEEERIYYKEYKGRKESGINGIVLPDGDSQSTELSDGMIEDDKLMLDNNKIEVKNSDNIRLDNNKIGNDKVELNNDKVELDNDNKIGNGKVDVDNTGIGNDKVELDNNKIEVGDKESDELDENSKVNNEESKNNPSKETASYILAISENIFYFFKFDGTFHLLAKLMNPVRMAYFNTNLFLLSNSEIYGFGNPIEQPKSIKIDLRPIPTAEQATEEYLYKILSKGKKLIFENEFGTEDIARDWNGFFIYNSNIHKVLLENKKNVFVYKNQKYVIDGTISQIFCVDDTLVFYSNLAKEGHLYFVGTVQKSFILPKISCLCLKNDRVAVATCMGDAVIYCKGEFQAKVHLSDETITGIALDGPLIYFSKLTGEVGFRRIKKSKLPLFIIITVVVLIVALVISKYFLK